VWTVFAGAVGVGIPRLYVPRDGGESSF